MGANELHHYLSSEICHRNEGAPPHDDSAPINLLIRIATHYNLKDELDFALNRASKVLLGETQAN